MSRIAPAAVSLCGSPHRPPVPHPARSSTTLPHVARIHRGALPALLVALLMLMSLGARPGSASDWVHVWSKAVFSSIDSSTPKTAQSSCPEGLVALGGGAAMEAPDYGYVGLLQSGSIGSVTAPTGWTAYGYEFLPYSEDWPAEADVVCGNLPGYERLIDGTGLDSSSPKAVQVTCPPGKVPIGGGAKIVGAPDSLVLTCNMVSNFLRDGWSACAEELFPTDQNWLLLVEVVCADPPPGYTFVSESSSLVQSTGNGASVYCPPGTLVLSGGAWVSPNRGIALMGSLALRRVTDGTLPSGGTQFFTGWKALGAPPSGGGYTPEWQVVTSALCANGPALLLDGFESGDTSAWSSSAP